MAQAMIETCISIHWIYFVLLSTHLEEVEELIGNRARRQHRQAGW
jgi:hypothetical protein